MSMNQKNRYDLVREELYRSLEITSDNNLMNGNEWVADDSHYSFKTIIHLDDDGEYIEEVENDEEDILGEEFEEYNDDRELVDAFTKEEVGAGPISKMSVSKSLKRDSIAHD
ncbi:hypothetical protein BC332_27876 [Capsicum chinense]|nr:hypothetical protein BC332_27876 [Capsicum chinense]